VQSFVYVDLRVMSAEGELIRAYEKADPERALRNAKDAIRRLKDDKDGNGASGSPAREPDSQVEQHGGAGGGGVDAMDEMRESLNILQSPSDPIDMPLQVLTNQEEQANFEPPFTLSRTCTDVSEATTATMVATSGGTMASLKAIKASSRKPTSQSVVSQWLRSNYGSEGNWKRKRKRANLEVEAQSAVGGSLVGTINLVLSPEQERVVATGAEEDLPVMVMDINHTHQPMLKRRRLETPLQLEPFADTCFSPVA